MSLPVAAEFREIFPNDSSISIQGGPGLGAKSENEKACEQEF
jgi:hypothetical protein